MSLRRPSVGRAGATYPLTSWSSCGVLGPPGHWVALEILLLGQVGQQPLAAAYHGLRHPPLVLGERRVLGLLAPPDERLLGPRPGRRVVDVLPGAEARADAGAVPAEQPPALLGQAVRQRRPAVAERGQHPQLPKPVPAGQGVLDGGAEPAGVRVRSGPQHGAEPEQRRARLELRAPVEEQLADRLA